MLAEAQNTKAPDPLTSLKHYLQKDLEGVNKIIDEHLNSAVSLIPKVARHLIQAGGKRLRPLLTLASYRLFNAEGDEAFGLAAAVEFIHTATLLHDDVIDESKLRRGRPTANEMWGNEASVLVGDFLFARAFQLMIESNNAEVLRILARTSSRIAEGEVLQLSVCHDLEASVADALQVIESKTAALFAAACEVGALMAGKNEFAEALRTFGLNLGMAFQIVDDVLDYGASTDRLGKEVGDDFREGKITLPVLLTYSQSQADERELLKRVFVDNQQTPEDFSKVLKLLQNYGGLSKALKLAKGYGEKAHEALKVIPPHPIKDLLICLVEDCLERES